MKAIVVREPYVSFILRGEKTWEMRKAVCRYRGPIALISKGSGTIVGTAEIIDSLPAIESAEAYAEAEPMHRVPPSLQQQAFADGWRTPWVLTKGHRLPFPVPYKHPSGAVVWVTLDENVAAKIRNQSQENGRRPQPTMAHETLGEEAPSLSPGFSRQPASAPSEEATLAQWESAENRVGIASNDVVRKVTVTGGNIRSNHIYLPLEFFEPGVIGGSNKSKLAAQTISVTFKPGQVVETDIDGGKRILRARSAVADFFIGANVREDDVVCIKKTGAFSYEISKEVHD